MSISDMIVVMKEGVVQQIGAPQEVYDEPKNLFVAKFLGTPPINVFSGEIRENRLWIGDEAILETREMPDRKVTIAIRPEGFVPKEDGALSVDLIAVEVMGRDTSVVSKHPKSENVEIRSIISSENRLSIAPPKVRFDIKPYKTFVFDPETEERIAFSKEDENG